MLFLMATGEPFIAILASINGLLKTTMKPLGSNQILPFSTITGEILIKNSVSINWLLRIIMKPLGSTRNFLLPTSTEQNTYTKLIIRQYQLAIEDFNKAIRLKPDYA